MKNATEVRQELKEILEAQKEVNERIHQLVKHNPYMKHGYDLTYISRTLSNIISGSIKELDLKDLIKLS